MTWFLDRNYGRRVAASLRLLGLDAIGHDEVFPIDADDAEWLAETGRRGWVVITHDANIAWNGDEALAVERSLGRCFVLPGGNAPSWEKVRELAFAWRKITAILDNETPPYVWRRSARGWDRLYP